MIDWLMEVATADNSSNFCGKIEFNIKKFSAKFKDQFISQNEPKRISIYLPKINGDVTFMFYWSCPTSHVLWSVVFLVFQFKRKKYILYKYNWELSHFFKGNQMWCHGLGFLQELQRKC